MVKYERKKFEWKMNWKENSVSQFKQFISWKNTDFNFLQTKFFNVFWFQILRLSEKVKIKL